jgi:hypothetical protein
VSEREDDPKKRAAEAEPKEKPEREGEEEAKPGSAEHHKKVGAHAAKKLAGEPTRNEEALDPEVALVDPEDPDAHLPGKRALTNRPFVNLYDELGHEVNRVEHAHTRLQILGRPESIVIAGRRETVWRVRFRDARGGEVVAFVQDADVSVRDDEHA